MSKLAIYSRSGPIGNIVMDDGKLNIMSVDMLAALHRAFDEAERDKTIAVLTGRGKAFSAGFDLNVFAAGSAKEMYTMLKSGAELALRLLSFPLPVVAACNGHALPMGAFLLMASDIRVAAEGAYQIGMNEVAIALTVPRFAVEIAFRNRLTPPYFNRLLTTGQMLPPAEAAAAGFVDWTVPAVELDAAAAKAAQALSKIDMAAHAATKLRVRASPSRRSARRSTAILRLPMQRSASLSAVPREPACCAFARRLEAVEDGVEEPPDRDDFALVEIRGEAGIEPGEHRFTAAILARPSAVANMCTARPSSSEGRRRTSPASSMRPIKAVIAEALMPSPSLTSLSIAPGFFSKMNSTPSCAPLMPSGLKAASVVFIRRCCASDMRWNRRGLGIAGS